MEGEPEPTSVQPIHAVLHEPPVSLEHLAGPQQPSSRRPRREEPLKPLDHQGNSNIPVSKHSHRGYYTSETYYLVAANSANMLNKKIYMDE